MSVWRSVAAAGVCATLAAAVAQADSPRDVARRLEQSVDPRVTGLAACARDGTAMEDCGMGSITRCPACRIRLQCPGDLTVDALLMVGVELPRRDGGAGPADASATLRVGPRAWLTGGVNVGLYDDGKTYFRRSSEFDGGSDSLTSYVPVAGPPAAKVDSLCAYLAKKSAPTR